MTRPASALAALILLACMAAVPPANGQAWPQKPVRLIVPFPPASTADLLARMLGQKLSQRLGQPFVVENRAGASGNIGADVIAKSTPDGYTIGVVTASTQAVAATLSPSLPYDPIRDFTPISLIAISPYVLVVRPGLPVDSVAELVALARRKPRELNYGSAGAASLAHLAGALFATLTQIKLIHVPYKSTAESVIDLSGGRLDMQFATTAPSIEDIRAGKLRALAVTDTRRVDVLPDVPTMQEAGVPDYEATLWFALMGPARLPAEVEERLNREVNDALGSPELQSLLALQGLVAQPGPPQALADRVRTDIAKWRELVPNAGITAE